MRTTVLTFFALASPLLSAIAGCSGAAGGSPALKLEGSGASFPSSLYKAWFKSYYELHPEIQTEYQSVGSGKGVNDFLEGRSDFGASDAAMSEEEIRQAEEKRGVLLLPMTAGSIVVAYHGDLPADLKLSRDVYSAIFLGEITNWSDPRIAEANPGVALPDLQITVVHRSDKSGTTYVFTRHLSAISKSFEEKLGFGKEVNWPNDGFIAGAKNDGVAANIKQTAGAIGYIEYGYSQTAGLPVASLQNQAGRYVAPTLESASRALANVELPESLVVWASDPPGDESYPIVTYTWIMIHKKYDPVKGKAIMELMTWCLTEGQKMSEKLHFIPLPESVTRRVAAELEKVVIEPESKS